MQTPLAPPAGAAVAAAVGAGRVCDDAYRIAERCDRLVSRRVLGERTGSGVMSGCLEKELVWLELTGGTLGAVVRMRRRFP
jgi:hypothetical protein